MTQLDTNAALQRHLLKNRHDITPLPRVVCRDGFTLSVQASVGAYCSPRNNTGPWVSVEIGFPSEIEPLLFEYAERTFEGDDIDYTTLVYPYVPVELTCVVIEAHGGFCEKFLEERVY